jgi:hypothetical protein
MNARLAVSLLLICSGGLALAAPPAVDPGYEPNVLDVKFKDGDDGPPT